MDPNETDRQRTWPLALHIPLSGVKRTCRYALRMSAYDPKGTSVRVHWHCLRLLIGLRVQAS